MKLIANNVTAFCLLITNERIESSGTKFKSMIGLIGLTLVLPASFVAFDLIRAVSKCFKASSKGFQIPYGHEKNVSMSVRL